MKTPCRDEEKAYILNMFKKYLSKTASSKATSENGLGENVTSGPGSKVGQLTGSESKSGGFGCVGKSDLRAKISHPC